MSPRAHRSKGALRRRRWPTGGAVAIVCILGLAVGLLEATGGGSSNPEPTRQQPPRKARAASGSTSRSIRPGNPGQQPKPERLAQARTQRTSRMPDAGGPGGEAWGWSRDCDHQGRHLPLRHPRRPRGRDDPGKLVRGSLGLAGHRLGHGRMARSAAGDPSQRLDRLGSAGQRHRHGHAGLGLLLDLSSRHASPVPARQGSPERTGWGRHRGGSRTPPGQYFAAFFEATPSAGYGPFIMVTSAHSTSIANWEGSGDAVIGIHGPLWRGQPHRHHRGVSRRTGASAHLDPGPGSSSKRASRLVDQHLPLAAPHWELTQDAAVAGGTRPYRHRHVLVLGPRDPTAALESW